MLYAIGVEFNLNTFFLLKGDIMASFANLYKINLKFLMGSAKI